MSLKLSVLDQSAAAQGRGQDATIRQTLALAEQAEAWGYHRFWVSEHHSHPSIVGSAPEVLMAAIAARTQRIRIGSAGVMLPHYAALKVAEQFRVLDALAPGRIDLGVGRAPGSDGRTAQLLNPDRNASERFPQQVMELQAWVSGHNLPPGHPGHNVYAYPQSETSPDVWMLGSSDYGAQLAAHLGLPYAFAYFITDGQGADEALQIYRETFRPSVGLQRPSAALCVWALAADTDEEALALQADGVDIIQFDEPAFNVYMDDAADWGVQALEIAARGLTCTTAVHICYGYGIEANNNWKKTLGDEWRQYEKVFPALAKSSIQQVSLECMHSHVPMEMMKLLEGKDVMVGVIDVANPAIETPEEIADTIGRALQFVPKNRLIACTNCGLAPMSRAVAEAKLKALAEGAKLASQRYA